MMKDSNADDDIIKALKPKEREVYNVIATKDDPDKILLWDVSSYLFGRTLEEELRKGPDEYADFAELEGGYTLKVRFGEKKMGKTTFLETTRIDFKEREKYDEGILDDVVDLDSILNVLDYAKLSAVFYGADEEPQKPADEEKTSRRGRDESTDKGEEKSSRRERGGRGEEKNKDDNKVDEGKKEEKQPRRNRGGDDIPPFDEESAASAKTETEGKSGGRRSGKEKEKEKEKESSGECPEGYAWGTDNDEHPLCDKCKTWDACANEKDRLVAEARRASRSK